LRADAARGDRPTPLGAPRPPTPTLDSLATRSATLAAAYSPSSGTFDTFASLFGDAALPGLIDVEPPSGWLAQRVAGAGYRVSAFVDYPFAPRGWGWPRIESHPSGDPRMADAAIDSLARGNSAFVWIHWMPLHAQVLSPLSAQAYSAARQRQRYARGLAGVDALLARMLARLRESGLAESTLVLLSADHGEELGEHGHYHHNLSLYEPAVRVPLWISGPGVVPGERPDVVPQRDLVPTLLEAAGLDAGGSPSRSLWPALADPSYRVARSLIYLFLPQRGFSRKHSRVPAARGQAALVDPAAGRKVIFDLGRERIEAYDLEADPLERVNLAGAGLTWVRAMEAALDSALAANARPPAGAGAAGTAIP
jgi:arylsulfatase A-like enzyme